MRDMAENTGLVTGFVQDHEKASRLNRHPYSGNLCNGSTVDFDSARSGSNPLFPAITRR